MGGGLEQVGVEQLNVGETVPARAGAVHHGAASRVDRHEALHDVLPTHHHTLPHGAGGHALWVVQGRGGLGEGEGGRGGVGWWRGQGRGVGVGTGQGGEGAGAGGGGGGEVGFAGQAQGQRGPVAEEAGGGVAVRRAARLDMKGVEVGRVQARRGRRGGEAEAARGTGTEKWIPIPRMGTGLASSYTPQRVLCSGRGQGVCSKLHGWDLHDDTGDETPRGR